MTYFADIRAWECRFDLMAKGDDWSALEVSLTVADYMKMLTLELTGQAYNKTAHRQALLEGLSGRSHAAVELKHQNISAVLRDMGHFWISGYKPRSNYQTLLAAEVEKWVIQHPELDRNALTAAEAPAATPEHPDFSLFEVDRPTLRDGRESGVREAQALYGEKVRFAIKRDYAAREARNSSLGLAGEELVLKFEQYRLSKLGYDRLAGRVEHVSKSQGDGLGFDVLSFEESGKERFIEVKTTMFAKETPFFASSSELRFARKNAEQFFVYRLFEFKKAPKCYTLPGVIEDHCMLDPVSYRCSFL
jgi:hypothetical protein